MVNLDQHIKEKQLEHSNQIQPQIKNGQHKIIKKKLLYTNSTFLKNKNKKITNTFLKQVHL